MYDKLLEIITEYEQKLKDLLVEQEMRKEYPSMYIYSRFCDGHNGMHDKRR